jgi:hypothetical protein
MISPMSKPKRRRRELLPASALEFFRQQGAKGGRIGGHLSWTAMTPEERSARAKKASLAGVAARRRKAKTSK